MEKLLHLDAVSFAYGKEQVLREVSFSVEEQESFCVIGPNGGGKSTLLKLLLGILKPSSGAITIRGNSPMKARKEIAYVAQSMHYDPYFPASVLDVVLMGSLEKSRFHPFPRWSRALRDRAHESLQQVDLSGLEKSAFHQLSGGQRQRVVIARALMAKPSILLLDEPTANVDLAVESQLMETLTSLQKEMAVIMVTHDMGLVPEIGSRALCVNRRVHWHDLPLEPEMIQDIYSGVRRIEHNQTTLHSQGDHSACNHD